MNIQEFVRNVERFMATESLDHESVNKSGAVFLKAQRNYNYMASVAEIRPNIVSVEEFLNSPSSLPDTRRPCNKGIARACAYLPSFLFAEFRDEVRRARNLKRAKSLEGFFPPTRRPAQQNALYKIGLNGPAYAVPLKGRAWFVPDTFQIVGLETDLIHSLPEVQLVVDHTLIEYGPVFFPSRGADFWLPQNAEVYSDFRGKRVH